MLTNVTIAGNSAAYYGGGIGNYGSGNGTATLTNVTIAGNSAEYGGGLDDELGTATLTNVTIAGNSADYGGGLYDADAYLDEGTVTLNNTVVANSTSGGDIDIVGRSVSGDNNLIDAPGPRWRVDERC